MRLSIAEIVNKAAELKTEKERVEWLQKHKNDALRTVLKFTYDPTVEFLIPDTPPPWKKMTILELKVCYTARRVD